MGWKYKQYDLVSYMQLGAFQHNVSSQSSKPSFYLGVHLLEKCMFLGCSRPSELLFLLKHLALSDQV